MYDLNTTVKPTIHLPHQRPPDLPITTITIQYHGHPTQPSASIFFLNAIDVVFYECLVSTPSGMRRMLEDGPGIS